MRRSNAFACCAGELKLPFFPPASLFSVVRKGTLVAFRSIGCALSIDHAVCLGTHCSDSCTACCGGAPCRTGPWRLCRIVMQVTCRLSGNSYRADGRLLRAVRGRKLPGIGGHALGDSQAWWQQEAGLLVSSARGGEVRL
jgi:hypothetical protein